MEKKRKWSNFILLIVFFIGLSVMLYPAISSYWNSRTQSKAIINYEKQLENVPKQDYESILKRAEQYNKNLTKLDYPLLNYSEVEGYSQILDVSGTGMIGYVAIESIGVELPIYHGTSEAVLGVAVGHLQGTSLPIGGKKTHSVISAHRGLSSATLFTNLDHLEIGDEFIIKVLDRTLTYQVDQIRTVEPADTTDLDIEPGKDMCTLLTCTPYGVNTHRLLVRGKRVDNHEEKAIHILSDAHQIEPLIVTPIVALPMILILMLFVLLKPVKKEDLGDDLE